MSYDTVRRVTCEARRPCLWDGDWCLQHDGTPNPCLHDQGGFLVDGSTFDLGRLTANTLEANGMTHRHTCKYRDIAVHPEPASLTPLVAPWHCFRVFCPPPVRRPWGALPHRLAHSLARSLADAWTVNKTVPKKGSTFVCFSPVSQALVGVLFPR